MAEAYYPSGVESRPVPSSPVQSSKSRLSSRRQKHRGVETALESKQASKQRQCTQHTTVHSDPSCLSSAIAAHIASRTSSPPPPSRKKPACPSGGDQPSADTFGLSVPAHSGIVYPSPGDFLRVGSLSVQVYIWVSLRVSRPVLSPLWSGPFLSRFSEFHLLRYTASLFPSLTHEATPVQSSPVRSTPLHSTPLHSASVACWRCTVSLPSRRNSAVLASERDGLESPERRTRPLSTPPPPPSSPPSFFSRSVEHKAAGADVQASPATGLTSPQSMMMVECFPYLGAASAPCTFSVLRREARAESMETRGRGLFPPAVKLEMAESHS